MNSKSEGVSTMRFSSIAKRAALLTITGLVFCELMLGQTLTIRLLNAKSGKPFGKQNVTLHWDVDFERSVVRVGSDGVGFVQIPPNVKSFHMTGGPRKGREPYRVAYADCNDRSVRSLSTSKVLEEGVVPGNACGDASFRPEPGEVVFWALPLPKGPDMQ
jgi:hypothetical protein